jgi:hypothetical protein
MGDIAGTFTARITFRKPDTVTDEATVKLPTGVGLEARIAKSLQDALEEGGSALQVASVTVERTDQ